MQEMKVTFLGTSSSKPTKDRNTTCMSIELHNNRFVLVDCGEGAQHQILKSKLKFNNLIKIFITHLHGDHIFGLPGILASLNECRIEPLEIYGPKGIAEFISSIAKPPYFRMGGYPLQVYEIEHNSKLKSIQIDNETITVKPCFVKHSVECYGYVFDKLSRVSNIDFVKVKPIIEKYKDEILEMGFKHQNQIITTIKDQKDIKFKDGFEIKHKDYISFTEAKRLVVLMDNYDSSKIFELIDHTDNLIHECTFAITEYENRTNQTEEQLREHAIYRGHSTASMAGEVAKKLKVKNLMLTHFSNRYIGLETLDESVTNNVKEVYPDVQVHCAKDFMEVMLI